MDHYDRTSQGTKGGIEVHGFTPVMYYLFGIMFQSRVFVSEKKECLFFSFSLLPNSRNYC